MSDNTPSPIPLWLTETEEGHSQRFVEHFRDLRIKGADLEGEARLLDAIVAPHSLILDAGCGAGRVAGTLHQRGHRVFGVDIDPILIDAAKIDYLGPTWIQADLYNLDLRSLGFKEEFDACILAGNVMPYLAVGTGARVLSNVAKHLRKDAPVVVGFSQARGYSLKEFDRDLSVANLETELRFNSWDLRPWTSDSDYLVTIARTR